MAVEGFNYTRNVYRYNGRLYIWAAIMFVGNTLLNHLVNNPAVTVHNNIFHLSPWCQYVNCDKSDARDAKNQFKNCFID